MKFSGGVVLGIGLRARGAAVRSAVGVGEMQVRGSRPRNDDRRGRPRGSERFREQRRERSRRHECPRKCSRRQERLRGREPSLTPAPSSVGLVFLRRRPPRPRSQAVRMRPSPIAHLPITALHRRPPRPRVTHPIAPPRRRPLTPPRHRPCATRRPMPASLALASPTLGPPYAAPLGGNPPLPDASVTLMAGFPAVEN
jgi:hypothetical protein